MNGGVAGVASLSLPRIDSAKERSAEAEDDCVGARAPGAPPPLGALVLVLGPRRPHDVHGKGFISFFVLNDKSSPISEARLASCGEENVK